MLRAAQSFVQTMARIHKIHAMDIRSIDLNLLVVLDAMARLGSVNRAAEALSLSQPATSAALARLRRLLGDPLYVRVGAQMKPTPRAEELAPVVRRVIETIDAEILRAAPFEPVHSDRGFTVLTPDIGEVAFLPGVLHRLRTEAPRVRLTALALPPKTAADALESGAAELAVGFFPDLQKAGFFQQSLFRTSYVGIGCARNGTVADAPTLEQYLQARHVVVRPDGREHALDRFLDDAGHRRNVVLELSHFMSLLSILPGTDLVATVPEDIATVVGRHIRLRRIVLPLAPPTIHVQQFWHRRMQNDAAHRWLRGVFHAVNRRGPNEKLRAAS